MTPKDIIIIREKLREASDGELYQLFASLANSYNFNLPSFFSFLSSRLENYEKKTIETKRKEIFRRKMVEKELENIQREKIYSKSEREKAKDFLKRFDKNSIVYVDRDVAGYIVIEEYSLNPRYLRSSQNFREDHFPSVKKRTLLTDIVNC